MTRALRAIALLFIIASPTVAALQAQTSARFRHVATPVETPADTVAIDTVPASLLPAIDSTKFIVRNLAEIEESIETPNFEPVFINKVFGPWVFSGYRELHGNPIKAPSILTPIAGLQPMTNDTIDAMMPDSIEYTDNYDIEMGLDSALMARFPHFEEPLPPAPPLDIDVTSNEPMPLWLQNAIRQYRMQEEFIYRNMIRDPYMIDNAYWNLPVRPELPEDEVSFAAYMRKLDLPDIDPEKVELPEEDLRQIHWLHKVNASAQFSQAYVSSNWYQGGNNHLALLLGFNWNVQLNPVYHPKLLFQSTLSYKLGLNSTPQDEVHDYSISEDLLQYNLNAGLKAWDKWFYSLNALFKTQLLNNYKPNSMTRKASFMSPGDFNVGLGMSYSTISKDKNFQLTATISPISYNLKTCFSDKVDHAQFNIPVDKKAHHEIGSNGEINMNWNIMWNINYKSRLFLFTDYKYFLSDWEHTVSFNVNKFLSTQIYIHMRYDTSMPSNTKWKKFQLREVLSFGLSYTFSTKK